MPRAREPGMAVLPGYTDARTCRRRVCAYLVTGGVPTTGCPGSTPTNPAVTVPITTIAMRRGRAAVQVKRVQLTYTHNFMFIGPIVGLMGGSWTQRQGHHDHRGDADGDSAAADPPTPRVEQPQIHIASGD